MGFVPCFKSILLSRWRWGGSVCGSSKTSSYSVRRVCNLSTLSAVICSKGDGAASDVMEILDRWMVEMLNPLFGSLIIFEGLVTSMVGSVYHAIHIARPHHKT